MRALALALLLSGCATAGTALPVAGETLLRLSDAYYAVCGRDEATRGEECRKAKESLNAAIDAYMAVNVAAGGDE